MSTDPWLFVTLFALSLSTVAALWWKIGRSQQGKELREELERGKEAQRKALRDELERLERHLNENSKTQREELRGNREELSKTLREKFEDVEKKVKELNATTERHLGGVRESTEKKLEKIRETVEEKLQETLNKRLNESFKRVQDSLDKVTLNMGEMNALTKDVGDLKRVLSNVKSRGVLGEVQLGSILEDILLPEQYEKEYTIGGGRVDYVVKLPGQDAGDPLYLPIDSKYPQEAYARLQEAYEKGEKEEIESAKKELFRGVRAEAKSIREKYIRPPKTTHFAVMFVPTEGLYAEIIREPGLMDELRQKHGVLPTGPTMLGAFLSSLRIGFQTLIIQKRSNEAWRVLREVKEEFGKFESALLGVQGRIQKADSELSALISTRTNAMHRRLRSVENLPESTTEEPTPASPELPLSPPEEG